MRKQMFRQLCFLSFTEPRFICKMNKIQNVKVFLKNDNLFG